MKKTARKRQAAREERPLFDPARKPSTTPHGHPLSRAKPEDRAHPAERKAKHKRRPGDGE